MEQEKEQQQQPVVAEKQEDQKPATTEEKVEETKNEREQENQEQEKKDDTTKQDGEQQIQEKKEEIDQDKIMKYGDMVIMYVSVDLLRQIILTEGEEEGTVHGHFPHSNFVGKQYGSKILARGKGGISARYVYALKPSPSLITTSLKHMTQIIYQSDISFIMFKLNIMPGSKVIETGTGSGSLSCGILTTIQDTGYLYTFEFNIERVENARKLFNNFGFKNVDVIHRDTIGLGFLNQEGQNFDVQNADAVFLDLPAPYKAIKHAKQVLRKGGYLACYSPCMEQCQRNTDEIWEQGFSNVHTIEIVHRIQDRNYQEFKSAFDVNEVNVKRKRDEAFKSDALQFVNKQFTHSYGKSFGHTAYLTFAVLV